MHWRRAMPTEDPAALVAEARAAHEVCGGEVDCHEPVCVECVEAWPCLPERLARALEAAQTEVRNAIVEVAEANRNMARSSGLLDQLDAARADAAEQRARVEHREKRWRELAE